MKKPKLPNDDIREIIDLKGKGWQDKQIASWLGCTLHQVRYYCQYYANNPPRPPEYHIEQLTKLQQQIRDEISRECALARAEARGPNPPPPYRPTPEQMGY